MLKQQKLTVSALETGSPRPSCGDGGSLLRAVGENVFQASLLTSGGLLAIFHVPWLAEAAS